MQERVSATTTELFTSKVIPLTFLITPSPIAYNPATTTGRIAIAAAQRAAASAPLVGSDAARELAYNPVRSSDLGPAPFATSSPQGNVKVQFTVKVDPTAMYLHIVPGAINPIPLGYGANNVTCAFQVYAYYPGYAYYVTDYVQGSASTGGGGANNGFPTYNYPTTSLLEWLAETKTTSFAPFTNNGLPGQTTFTGTAGEKQTICIDLSVNVPNTVAAGTYNTAIQYNLYVVL
jgi:hypothetical protein